MFINAKVEQALKKLSMSKKVKKSTDMDIAINTFERCCKLDVANSNKEDRKLPAV